MTLSAKSLKIDPYLLTKVKLWLEIKFLKERAEQGKKLYDIIKILTEKEAL